MIARAPRSHPGPRPRPRHRPLDALHVPGVLGLGLALLAGGACVRPLPGEADSATMTGTSSGDSGDSATSGTSTARVAMEERVIRLFTVAKQVSLESVNQIVLRFDAADNLGKKATVLLGNIKLIVRKVP